MQESENETATVSEKSVDTPKPQAVKTSEPNKDKDEVAQNGNSASVAEGEKNEIQSDKTERIITLPSKRKNGFSMANGFDITKIVLAMAGASGLLLLLFIRRRH
jgi:hypothetical protein